MQNGAAGQIKQVIKQSVYYKFNKCLFPHVVPHIRFHLKHILVKPAAKKTCWTHFAMDFWHQVFAVFPK